MRPLRLLHAPLTLSIATLSVFAGCGDRSNPPEQSRPSSSRQVAFGDIAVILEDHCVRCHRPGGSGPFSLVDYESARRYGNLIVRAVERGDMPPWLPDTACADFQDERVLARSEIERIRRWVQDGMPAGSEPRDAMLGYDSAADGLLDTAEAVVSFPEAYALEPGPRDVFRFFVIPSPFPETRYVEAVELRTRHPRRIHHATLAVDPGESSRRLDEEDPGVGFSGMYAPGAAQTPEGYFVGWPPGSSVARSPEGMPWRLRAGNDLVVQLHLRPGEETVTIQPEFRFEFADGPGERLPFLIHLGSHTIDIPPGESEYEIRDRYRLPVDVQILSVFPHAHYLGKEMHISARTPDGQRRCLLRIGDWDFNWQDQYRYAEPAELPAGTTLEMRFTYDNSAGNPQNPNDPPRRVVFGPNANDEMGDLWIQVLARNETDRMILARDFRQKELMLRRAGLKQMVRLNPDQPIGHLQLANVLKSLGRLQEAIRHYRRAIEIQGDLAAAHNNLGNALRALGRTDQAVVHYRAAIRSAPGDPKPHLNLGEVLASFGMVDAALAEFRRALALDSSYVRAHQSLSSTLLAQGKLDVAVQHLRRAVALAPEDPGPKITLAWVLATNVDDPVHDPAAALRLAHEAADLTGHRDPTALHTLAAALAASGRFDRAVETEERALELARQQDRSALARAIQDYLSLYRRASRSRSEDTGTNPRN